MNIFRDIFHEQRSKASCNILEILELVKPQEGSKEATLFDDVISGIFNSKSDHWGHVVAQQGVG